MSACFSPRTALHRDSEISQKKVRRSHRSSDSVVVSQGHRRRFEQYIAKVATSANGKLFNGFTGSTFFHLVPIHSIHLVKFYSFANLRRRAAIRSIMQLRYLYLILPLSGRFARCSSSSFVITIVKT